MRQGLRDLGDAIPRAIDEHYGELPLIALMRPEIVEDLLQMIDAGIDKDQLMFDRLRRIGGSRFVLRRRGRGQE